MSEKETEPTTAVEEPVSDEKKEADGDVQMEPSTAEKKATESATNDSKEATTEEPTKDWDKTNLKVIVHNVIKYTNRKGVEKMVNGWVKTFRQKNPGVKMEYERIKKPPNEIFCVITFMEESMCQPFIDFVNASGYQNKKGDTINAILARNSASHKRQAEDDGGGRSAKRTKMTTAEKIAAARRPVSQEEIKDKMTPLWKLSEEEQRDQKMKEMIRNCARKLIGELKKRFRYVLWDT